MASKFNTSADKIKAGDKFGKYTVLEVSSPSSLCRCSCGAEKMVRNSFMLAGRVCGCHACANKKIRPGRRVIKTDISKGDYARLGAVVRNAIARCTDESHAHWRYYGGRGVRVAKEWVEDPSKFLAYLLALPGHDDPTLVIDRKDNNGHYEPGNLKFSTRSESQRNKGPHGRRVMCR